MLTHISTLVTVDIDYRHANDINSCRNLINSDRLTDISRDFGAASDQLCTLPHSVPPIIFIHLVYVILFIFMT